MAKTHNQIALIFPAAKECVDVLPEHISEWLATLETAIQNSLDGKRHFVKFGGITFRNDALLGFYSLVKPEDNGLSGYYEAVREMTAMMKSQENEGNEWKGE